MIGGSQSEARTLPVMAVRAVAHSDRAPVGCRVRIQVPPPHS